MAACILLLAVLPVLSQTPPVPAAYYPLNGDVLDYSGNGLQGANHGVVFTTNGYAAGAGAAQFNGTTSYIQIPRSIGVTGSGFTIAMWIKTTQTAGTPQWYSGKGLVDGDLPGNQDDFGTALVGSKFAVGIGNPDVTLSSKAVINNGNWHHVAASWNMTSGALKIYVDGAFDNNGNATAGPRTSPSSLTIGRTPQDPNYFNGALADIRLYDSVLNTQQVATLASLQPVAPSVVAPVVTPTNFVYAGSTLTFNELTSGRPAPDFFQWNSNGVAIPGAKAVALVLTNVQVSRSADYSVSVGNVAGTNISPAVTVNVLPASAPVFTLQPSPALAQVGANGQVTFTAGVDGTPPISLQWQLGGVKLSGETNSSLTLSGVHTNNAGAYTLVASNRLGTNVSTVAELVVSAEPSNAVAINVPTYHYDNMRSGADTNEVIVAPGNVNTNTFGKLFGHAVDGAIYTQPLYVAGLAIPGKGTHDVVFVATQHGSVYAFDADDNQGANASPLWQVSFINAAAGVTPITPADASGCANIPHEECIDATPAIDLNTGTIYLEALTRELAGTNVTYVHRLHALDISTGAERTNSPVVISGSVPGNGVGGNGTNVLFNPILEQCRTGLLLQNGFLYFGYSSQCDGGNYHGWVMAYQAQTLQQVGIYNVTPNGSKGGIWHGGDGMAADANNNVFAMTGNGSFSTNNSDLTKCNLSDSFLKFSANSGMALTDYFTPYNQASLSGADLDVAAGGPMVLPDTAGSAAHPHLMLGTGKDGTIYLIDRDDMGHFNAADDSQIVQELPGVVGTPWSYPVPAFWNNTIYYQGNGSGLQAFHIANGVIDTNPAPMSSVIFGAPGGVPTVSANGTKDGIVWALQTDAWASSGAAVLRAFNATNLAQELYNSAVNPGRDSPGAALKWTVPVVASGKVYVGEEFLFSVYGNGLFVATPTVSPGGTAFTNSLTVTLGDSTPGAQIFYTLDGTPPTSNSIAYAGPLVLTNSTGLQVIAMKSGAVSSGVVSATFVNNSAVGTGTGLTGYYFTNQNKTFNGSPTLVRVDPVINFNVSGGSIDPSVGKTNYTIRWTGTVQPQFSETYTFYLTGDDGVRLWINGQQLVDGWVIQAAKTYTNSIALKAQQLYNIQIDYFQSAGGATAQLQWSSPSTPLAIVPQSQLYPYTNPPPAVALAEPANGSLYTATASVTLSAIAATAYNPIDRISFYSTSGLLWSVSNAPYALTVTGLGADHYIFSAVAVDSTGLSSTSAPVNVYVNSGSSGQPYGLAARAIAPAFWNMPGGPGGAMPALLSQTGVFTNTAGMIPASGLVPYAPNTPLWSDNAVKSRWMSVPYAGEAITADEQVGFTTNGPWVFPSGTVFVKTFSLVVDETNAIVPLRRLETRLLVRDTNGAVYGVTYKWRPDNSEADLLSSSLTENVLITNAAGVRAQPWYYPSPADCLNCHTPVAGYVLGLNTRQLNGNFSYASSGVTDNQLRALNRAGFFDSAFDEAAITAYPRMVSLTNLAASLENRVRSYVDANCAQCHQPGGVGPSFDARYDTPLAGQNLINGAVIASLGVDNAHVVSPHDIWRSMLYQRASSLTPGVKMPPLARNLADTNALSVMADWINSLAGLPTLAPPTIVPAGGVFSGAVSVTLLPPDTNATLYFTLDGSLPTTNSAKYAGPVVLTNSANLTANAIESGYNNSVGANGLFSIQPIVFASPATISNGVLRLQLFATPNRSYVMQASSNLTQWVPVSTSTPGSSPFFLTDPNAANFRYRFYRVFLVP